MLGKFVCNLYSMT